MSWHSWVPTPPAVAPNERVRCPRCKAPCTLDALWPVDEVPPAVRGHWKRGDVAYACGACRETLTREGHISPGDLARFAGAPEAVAAEMDTRRPHPALGRYVAEVAALDARKPRG